MARALLPRRLLAAAMALAVALGGFEAPGAVVGSQATPVVLGPRGDAQLTGAMPGAGPATTPAPLWEASSDGGIIMGLAIVDETVYMTSKDPGKVVAIDRATGAELWAADFGEEATVFGPEPADGAIAVGVWGENGANAVVALDAATGAERWRVATAQYPAAPTHVDGVLYVPAEGGLSEDTTLSALDAATGQQRWSITSPDRMDYGERLAIAEGLVIARTNPLDNGPGLVAFDATTGQEVWAFAESDGISFDPVIADGVVIAVDLPRVWGLDLRSGSVLWEASGTSAGGGVAVANGTVYIGFRDEIRALTLRTGEAVWSAPIGGIGGAPVVANGIVYSAAWKPSDDLTSHSLYAFDAATGASAWTLDLGDIKVSGNQPLADAGVLYVDANHALIAYSDGQSPATTGGPSGAVATEPPGAPPAGESGGQYASPEFGYVIAWQPPWQPNTPLINAQPGRDDHGLTTGSADLQIRASTLEMSPTDVVQFFLDERRRAAPDMTILNQGEDSAVSRATVMYSVGDVQTIEFIEVRALASGIVLTILSAPAGDFSQAWTDAQRLVTVDGAPPFSGVPI